MVIQRNSVKKVINSVKLLINNIQVLNILTKKKLHKMRVLRTLQKRERTDHGCMVVLRFVEKLRF